MTRAWLKAKLLRWGRELLIFGLLFAGILYWQRRNLLPEGAPAPTVTFRTLEGQPVTLASLKGKRVLLHFWATWCSVCGMEHGALNAVHAGLEPDEALISILDAGDTSIEALQAHLKEKGINYPVWLADRAALAAFQIKQYPTNYFLSPEGRLVNRDVGMSSRLTMAWRLGRAG
ncbi:TlpA family protein disulfide reductase, partial [Myxococcota bacterium]|nr:TlpA family protein disulfide reductase [Myxococcota bacterium]